MILPLSPSIQFSSFHLIKLDPYLREGLCLEARQICAVQAAPVLTRCAILPIFGFSHRYIRDNDSSYLAILLLGLNNTIHIKHSV